MSARQLFLIALAFIGLIIASTGFFTVKETEQVLVMRFGDPQRTVQDAGLHWKIPLIEQASYFDARVLNLDVPPQEVIASDQKRLVVDAFSRLRIVDPLLTFQRATNEQGAINRLETIMTSNIRRVLGSEAFRTIVSGERAELMRRIRNFVNQEAEDFGIEIVDVRLRRVDLPEANSQAIYNRMRTEREREAREARAEGQEQAARIRAQAARDRTVLLAEAERDAERIRGQGDRQAVKIFADAFGKDEAFFEFYRTMQAYRNALGESDTTYVLSPQSRFFDYFGRLNRAGDPNR